jgi:hypothetical protein
MPTDTELDALLERVREVQKPSNAAGRSLRFDETARDCLRMFEDLATRYKEEFASRDRYKGQSNAWRDKALKCHALLSEVAALDDGDERFAWKHEDLFKRIHAEVDNP